MLLFLTLVLAAPADRCELRVVDADTGRGVPLIELETTHHVRFVTDNHGRVALDEPGWAGRELFFTVSGHGYDPPTDGFGIAGVRVTPKPGTPAIIKLKRRLPAERVARLTGEGRFRDSVLLGHTPPQPPDPGRLVGQDTVQAVEYRGKVFWFWGDTNQLRYPLGLYRTAGATTPIPTGDPAELTFDYFTDANGFVRPMIPLSERPEGVVWVHGVCVLPDKTGTARMLAHYSRRKGLADQLEHGLAVYDDATERFVPATQLPAGETWRYLRGHPFVHDGWLLTGDTFPTVRVPATLEAALDPTKYEALTTAGVWQTKDPPADAKADRFRPADAADPKTRIVLHRGSVNWSAYRKRWVMIANREWGKDSHLGEVWYAEADAPTGPFAVAIKVASHDRQTFYNPVRHPFLDRDGGRVIHFEGTYTNQFSGNPHRTPRYEYNQILYRLDLDDPRLAAARR